MKPNKIEAYEFAKSRVSYDPNLGILTWLPIEGDHARAKTFNAKYAGKECKNLDNKGYIFLVVNLNGFKFNVLAHRLAWFITNGEIPDGEIDHINGIRNDNRLANLRCVSRSVNMRNARMPSNNKSGFIGVSYVKQTGKWRAKATGDGKRIHLGYFTSIDEAAAVVKEFRSANGYTDRHGA